MAKQILTQGLFEGERALYNLHDAEIVDSTFANGESPLKEGGNLKLDTCIFKWKYPLWYCNNVEVVHSILLDTARSGIWYTDGIKFVDSHIEAPKTFRRSKNITLINTDLPNAEETLWTCENVILKDVTARGNYLLMNSKNIEIDGFKLDGNYAFDGASNVVIRNAVLLSKDSFWNCENVTVYDSVIVGEYLAWNSKNITFINCAIDSNQGMCYMDNVKLVNCKLLNTDLSFERCYNIDAEVNSKIDSVKNPYSGKIVAKEIGELIMDEDIVDPSKTTIITEK